MGRATKAALAMSFFQSRCALITTSELFCRGGFMCSEGFSVRRRPTCDSDQNHTTQYPPIPRRSPLDSPLHGGGGEERGGGAEHAGEGDELHDSGRRWSVCFGVDVGFIGARLVHGGVRDGECFALACGLRLPLQSCCCRRPATLSECAPTRTTPRPRLQPTTPLRHGLGLLMLLLAWLMCGRRRLGTRWGRSLVGAP